LIHKAIIVKEKIAVIDEKFRVRLININELSGGSQEQAIKYYQQAKNKMESGRICWIGKSSTTSRNSPNPRKILSIPDLSTHRRYSWTSGTRRIFLL
jgi:hypothetical protein